MKILLRVGVLCSLLGRGVISFSHAAPAPVLANYPNPIIHLKVSELGHFDTALPALAKQGRVAIVCEGQPLHLDLTTDQTQQLAQRINPDGMPLEEAVKWVAAAYDYRTERTGANTFVLTKRYTDPNDLPDIPFEETTAAFQNILIATQNFYPAIDDGNAIYNILSTVSDAHRAQLAKGILISDLDADQKRNARSLVNSIEFRYLTDIDTLSRRLQACRNSSAYFTEMQKYGVTFPVYDAPYGYQGAMWKVALDGWFVTATGSSDVGSSVPSGVTLVNNKLVVNQPGLVEPTAPRPANQIPVPVSSKLRLTLAGACKQLTDRLIAAHVLLSVQTEAALSSKALCLAGAQYNSPQMLIQAIATVYGLDVQNDQGVETLIQPRPIILKDPKDMKAEFKRLLPAPYQRAVARLQHEDGFATIPAPTLLALGGAIASDVNTPDFSLAHASTLYLTSVRRLREIIEPEIRKHPNQKLPIAEADAEAQDMLGLSNLAVALGNFYSLSQPPVSYVTDLDGATLTLDQDMTNPQQIKFGIEETNSKGVGAGVGGQVGWGKFRDLVH